MVLYRRVLKIPAIHLVGFGDPRLVFFSVTVEFNPPIKLQLREIIQGATVPRMTVSDYLVVRMENGEVPNPEHQRVQATSSDAPANSDDASQDHQNTDTVTTMLQRLVLNEKAHFRHQTRGEAPLTAAEKMNLARDLFQRRPGVFLERFGDFLCWPEDRVNFLPLYHSNDVVSFFVDKLEKANSISDHNSRFERSISHRIRNRRFNALQQLHWDTDQTSSISQHFTHEAMRHRDPLLWESMVGKYLDDHSRREHLGREYSSFSGFLLGELVRKEEAKDFNKARMNQANSRASIIDLDVDGELIRIPLNLGLVCARNRRRR
ncbi:unnamed protein product [Dicrocoelium dendriticum]|nr:unnamed protein product [Dicrocoelium dendriticum]